MALVTVGPPAVERSSTRPSPVLFGNGALDSVATAIQPNSAYWRFVLENGTEAVATNLSARPGVLGESHDFVPVTIDRDEQDTSYPCSLVTQYVRYPLGEMRLLPGKLARQAARVGLRVLGGALDYARADRVVQWNSWLMSTNLLPPLTMHGIEQTTDQLASQFPGHAILVKNVHGRQDPDLPRMFLECGYHLIPSRKVYFFDGVDAGFLGRSNVKQDIAALRKITDYTTVEHHEFGPEDAPRIVRLYELLYLEKHSRLNPQYTTAFVEKALKHRFLEFRGLRHSSGRVDAVFACFRRESVVSTPFVGYDTTNQSRPDFYRLLVAMLFKRVAEEGTLLNYSSGAGEFKRRRGGEACIEFNALYTRHLSIRRQLAFSALSRCIGTLGARLLSSVAV